MRHCTLRIQCAGVDNSVLPEALEKFKHASSNAQNCEKKFHTVAPELGACMCGPLYSHQTTG